MKLSDNPTALAAYRETTKKSSTGFGNIRFVCKKCLERKPTGGSKKNTTHGWICKECVADNSGEIK